MIIGNP